MKKIFVNLKDYLNYEENINFIENMKLYSNDFIVFPSNAYLYMYKEKNIYETGVQNFTPSTSGNHTGQISLSHLKNFNIKWAIVNHREFPEQNINIIIEKIKKCIDENINIILCITEQEIGILKKLNNIINTTKKIEIIIAFEPINIYSISKISHIIYKIRKILSQNIKIIYGGNVSNDVIIDLEKINDLNGYLIAKHAINPESLTELIEKVK